MKKYNYLINGFAFQYWFFRDYINFNFDYIGANVMTPGYTGKIDTDERGNVYKFPSWKHIPENYKLFKKLYKEGKLQEFDIIHVNNTENFLNIKKEKNKIYVAESHGYDIGVGMYIFLKGENDIIKKFIGYSIDKIIGWKIRKKIREFDIYYCSTPNMLEPLKKIREDVKWLPNPIDLELFKPEGKVIKLEGNPACFMPVRLHSCKKLEYAINIFQNYIKPNFPEATLHLLNEGDSEFRKYKEILNDKSTYYWHDFMDSKTLAEKIRGSDFCFGDFAIGGLSLMPMQIMACKKPVVTYDMFEVIKVGLNDLETLTKKIFEDEEFRNNYIEKNYSYVHEFHNAKKISEMHIKNLIPLLKSKLGMDEKDIEKLILT